MGASWIPLPLSAVTAEGIASGASISSITGLHTDILTGTGALEGLKTARGGEISGEKILPLRVILLVLAIFPISVVSSSEFSSTDLICFTP